MKTPSNMLFLYSGRPNAEDEHRERVGLLLSKRMAVCLLDWKPVTERIITTRFQGHARNVTIIQCYAPTEAAETEIKQSFYAQLQEVYNKTKKKDIAIIMGDLNAQVGNDNLGFEEVMGKHGHGRMNENGGLFIEWCAANEMVIGGTLFPHKKIHTISRISPDKMTQNQIDHIAINRKWRTSLMDVRNKRGADINSYHYTNDLQSEDQIEESNRFSQTSKRHDVRRLKDKQIKEAFQLKLQK
jgi:hypothetical protein